MLARVTGILLKLSGDPPLLTQHRTTSPNEVAQQTSKAPADSRRSRTSSFVPLRAVMVGLVPIIAIVAWGLPYYAAPLAERLRSSYHDWLKPSGVIGLAAGFLAFALFAFLWLYPPAQTLGKSALSRPHPEVVGRAHLCGRDGTHPRRIARRLSVYRHYRSRVLRHAGGCLQWNRWTLPLPAYPTQSHRD